MLSGFNKDYYWFFLPFHSTLNTFHIQIFKIKCELHRGNGKQMEKNFSKFCQSFTLIRKRGWKRLSIEIKPKFCMWYFSKRVPFFIFEQPIMPQSALTFSSSRCLPDAPPVTISMGRLRKKFI